MLQQHKPLQAGSSTPSSPGLNAIFPPLLEAAVLGHGPAASGCCSGTRAASAALEPAFLTANLLPFVQIFPFFSGKQPSAASSPRMEPSGEPCPERTPGTGQGGRKILLQPCRAGPASGTQPLTPALCPLGAWDVFLRDQSFLLCTQVPDAEPWWPRALPWRRRCRQGTESKVAAPGPKLESKGWGKVPWVQQSSSQEGSGEETPVHGSVGPLGSRGVN